MAGGRPRGLKVGLANFKHALWELVAREDNYTPHYGQLRSPFVGNAPTLQAVAAFCGRLTGRIVNPRVRDPAKIHYRTAANHRVHAVVTANYDCFLESAASTVYRRSPLQPVTALGSPAASSTRIPVFHIHGYVPHPFYQTAPRTPAVDDLVITRRDYERVWRRTDVFGTTMGPQIHYLRYYTALFVGFSFADKYVRELLRRIQRDYLQYAGRTHFALLPRWEVERKGRDFFARMGVQPIAYADHQEIPRLLGRIYRAGLVADRILAGGRAEGRTRLPELQVRVHRPTGRRYAYGDATIWRIAQRLRNESVGAEWLREHGGERLVPSRPRRR